MPDGETSPALAGGWAHRRDDWLALVGDVTSLQTTTYDGITVEALYTAADGAPDPGLPGFSPFVRGRTATGHGDGWDGWDVRQLVDAGRGEGAAVAELERGATSVWLRADHAEQLAAALDGVLFDAAPVVLCAGRRWWQVAPGLLGLWDRSGADAGGITGGLGADPFGDWKFHGDDGELEHSLTRLADEGPSTRHRFPAVRLVTIDGTRYHDAGAADGGELGIVLAAAVATLRALPDALDLDDRFAAIELRLTASVDQFSTIAKFRAARRVWARVAEVCGDEELARRTPLHAVTSTAMTTRYDPTVNVVRATLASFAAGVGGADAVTVLPHDRLLVSGGSELGRRLARNTQSILVAEAHVAKVIDPAGGSWYVEHLTGVLAEAAWEVFEEIEAAGGFCAAVRSGIVDRRLSASRALRTSDVDHRRAPIIGVTDYPDLDEPPPHGRSGSGDGDGDDREHDVGRWRWAEGFESLRQRVDEASATTGRPTVLLVTVGVLAAAAPMAASAANLFGVAGLATVRVHFLGDTDALAAAMVASGSSVACLCLAGPDDGDAVVAARALVAAGATRLYVTGSAGPLDPPLAAGVTSTLDGELDLRAELTALVDHLGVA